MVKRKKIALIYQYDENWMGGVYYIQNLILALNKLHDSVKPELIIICPRKDHYLDLVEATNYPFIFHRFSLRHLSFFQRGINTLCRFILNKNAINLHHRDIDLVFPAYQDENFPTAVRLFWIPDFQEHYFPQFFNENEVIYRKSYQKSIIDREKFILFSSYSVRQDFNTFYPENKLEQFVLRFAVTLPKITDEIFDNLRQKYFLPSQYFICCNQFWKHKNHKIIFEAISLLKKKGRNPFVVFTGNTHDHRNPEYFEEMQLFINETGVSNNVFFLGLIARSHQLILLKNSIAVIQPSFFEGWSTVIEDAKSLNVRIIASNIAVHIEQLDIYPMCQTFSANNIEALVACMIKASECNSAGVYNYEFDIVQFGETFRDIIGRLTKAPENSYETKK